jgi:hypothetical protein
MEGFWKALKGLVLISRLRCGLGGGKAAHRRIPHVLLPSCPGQQTKDGLPVV